MPESFYLDVGQSIQSESGVWYRNVQLLGVGGNAVTFLAFATSGSNRGVLFAIKIFRRLSRPERRERFLKEIAFLREADHPAIMRVYDTGIFKKGSAEEFPFVVAEYLPQTFAEVIRAGQTTIPEKISYTLQLLSALSFLEHRNPQIVHRDIKPRNVFVKGGSCVLGDFGLLKVLDGSDELDREVLKDSSGPGMPIGYRTPDLVAYARGEAGISTKSDVFQLGLVVAELFTDRNPERPADDFYSPVQLDPVGHVPGELGAGVAALIRRMLEIDPVVRKPASEVMDGWQGVMEAAVKAANALEGRVFRG
jgi:serine/threonine protein kinase